MFGAGLKKPSGKPQGAELQGEAEPVLRLATARDAPQVVGIEDVNRAPQTTSSSGKANRARR